ncbi:speckle-type POZ protein-like B [Caerostris extrusa]|uniref:Speckle-type POZ protein-like B n=1 Tax=Caerostris extrusa TaxID=172846 RepID=A0AAV4V3T5_CAEEX|nr:speckle-type POZ protein-like B [Caerostris extrusa]
MGEMEEGFIKRYSHHSMSNVEDPRTKTCTATSADMGFACSKLRVEQNSFYMVHQRFQLFTCAEDKILSWQAPTNEEPKISLDLNISDYKNKRGSKHISHTKRNAVIAIMLSAFSISVLDAHGREEKDLKDIRDKLFSRIPPAIDLVESKSETFYEEEKDHSTFSCASHSLKKALKGLFEDGVLSDVILRTGDELFSIHRNIVSARSPLFRGMFDKETKENEIIDVPDLDADTLRKLLLFLYTETVKDLQWKNASDLFKAAHLYRIGDLEDVCSHFLRGNLSESNVKDALSMGEKFNDDNLKLAAMQFSSGQSK